MRKNSEFSDANCQFVCRQGLYIFGKQLRRRVVPCVSVRAHSRTELYIRETSLTLAVMKNGVLMLSSAQMYNIDDK